MAETNATPGSTFTGPIEVVAQTGLSAFGALPATMDDDTGGTADTTDFTIADVGTVVTGVDGTGSNAASKADVDTRLDAINNNFATLNALLDRILARIQ